MPRADMGSKISLGNSLYDIPDPGAALFRSDGRHHLVMMGGLDRNQQAGYRFTMPPLEKGDASLFQRSVDRTKRGVQGRAEAVDHSNDRESNSGGDQSVFNSGSARLIIPEFQNGTLHVTLFSHYGPSAARFLTKRNLLPNI